MQRDSSRALVNITTKLRNFGVPESQIDIIADFIKNKNLSLETLSEQEAANFFLANKLAGEKRIEHPQHPACEFCFVIPVYDEPLSRITSQVSFFKALDKKEPFVFEVIYVVNNGLVENGMIKVRERNHAVLKALEAVTGAPIYVIDKSSPGNETLDCNVGKARNRGACEASARFLENGKNGTIINTDADTIFDDITYLDRLSLLTKDPRIKGIGGGITFVFSPDDESENSTGELKAKAEKLTLFTKWLTLANFVRGLTHFVDERYRMFFTGAHMICKSFEFSVIGGFFEGSALEDVVLGLELEEYCAGTDMKVVEAKEELVLTTSLRPSYRTAGSLGEKLDQVKIDAPLYGTDPFKEVYRHQLKEKIEAMIKLSSLDPSQNILNYLHSILGDQADSQRSHLDIRLKKLISDSRILHDGELNAAIDGLIDAYLTVPITKESFEILAGKVRSSEKGQRLLNYIYTMTHNINL